MEGADLPEEPTALTVLNSETLSGDWHYTYSLKKNWDSDLSGDYETVTEIIESEGQAGLFDKGENHMAALILPGTMKVDGSTVELGNTPEAFSAWYDASAGCVKIQMKGTEQKYFAPGGAEPLVIEIPVAAGENVGGTYSHTYDKTVTEMNMRYEITVTLMKD